MSDLPIESFSDTTVLAVRAAGWMAERLTDLTEEGASTVLAVSGGRSPWPMFRRLVAIGGVPWERVHIVQVDERIAPDGDPDRNWNEVLRVFQDVVPNAHLHPMPVIDPDLDAAAAAYGELIGDLTGGRGLGVTHLGLGTDGHTASLFPEDAVLEARRRRVAVTESAHAGRLRMTLTLPTLNASQHILWQVQGESKGPMLRRLLDGDASIPAGRIRRSDAMVFADAAAACSQ